MPSVDYMRELGDSSRRRKAILFLNTATRPPLGADVRVHGHIMKQLDRSRFAPYVACAPWGSGGCTPTYHMVSQIPGLDVYPVDLGRERDGSVSARLRNLLSGARAVLGVMKLAHLIWRRRIAIVHSTDRPRDAFCCVLLSWVTPARSVVHLHVGYGGWMSRIRKWSLRRADAVISVSDFVKHSLLDAGHRSSEVHSVLNGIDLSDFGRCAARRGVRDEFGIPVDAPVILTVCRLFPAKGPGLLISALPALVRDWPDLRLVVVGEEMEGGYRDRLERLARCSGVERHVIFTGWRSDVVDFMASSDIFAMPSLEEPCALVYLEAMAMALPVVALSSGGTPELVQHGRSGLLSPPGDQAALESNLRCLLRSATLRAAMGARGRERVARHFTAERMTRDIEALYERISS